MDITCAKIHTLIVDGGNYPAWAKQAGLPAIAPFWEYVRALANGTGRANFSLQDAANMFGKSEKTIRRWLTLGTRYGFFRQYSTENGNAIVFHASLVKLCRQLNLPSWGVTAEVDLTDLKNAKVVATEIQIQHMQRASYYLAHKQARTEGYRGKIAKPETLLTSSATSTGALVQHVSEQRIFVSEQFKLYGVSQAGVGQVLGRSDRTIRRRVSNPLRQRHGLSPVLKRQLCQTKPEYARQDLYYRLCSNTDTGENKRFFRLTQPNNQTTVFKSECNLYGFDHPLLSCKTQRHFFNRLNQRLSQLGDVNFNTVATGSNSPVSVNGKNAGQK